MKRALLGLALFAAASGGAHAAPLESTRAIAAALAKSGRAEATIAFQPARDMAVTKGTLALEPPGLARLDFAATGERITLRSDGGEWLQPHLRQMVTLTPRHAMRAMQWWRIFSGAGEATEKKLGRRSYRLQIGNGADADVAMVLLDARGFPVELEFAAESGPSLFRISGWRFTKRRGAPAFHLTAPTGFETVEMP